MVSQTFDEFKTAYGALSADIIYDHMAMLVPHEDIETQKLLV